MGLRKYIGIGLLLATRGISLFAADPDKVQSIADYVQESPTSITALASDGNTYPGKARSFLINPNPELPNVTVRVDVLKFEQSGGIENLVFVHSSTTPDGRPSVISLYERKRIGVGVYDGRLDDAFVEQPISGSPSYQVDPNNPTLQNAHDVGVEKIHEQLPQNII